MTSQPNPSNPDASMARNPHPAAQPPDVLDVDFLHCIVTSPQEDLMKTKPIEPPMDTNLHECGLNRRRPAHRQVLECDSPLPQSNGDGFVQRGAKRQTTGALQDASRLLQPRFRLCALCVLLWLTAFSVITARAQCDDWVLTTTFTNPAPAADERFGFPVVAMGADRLVIGAHQHQGVGAAHLFHVNGTWLTTFTNPTPNLDDEFGGSLAFVGGDRVLVGAFGDDTVAPDGGIAYLFSTNGTLITTFTHPALDAFDYFGYAVAGFGSDRVVIGARADDVTGPNSGAAYLFDTSGHLLATFTNPAPTDYDAFGGAVAALGIDRVVIGAEWHDTPAVNAGAAYLFDTNGALLTTFTNPTPGELDAFGHAMTAVGTDCVLIGAPGHDTGTANAGAAYLFSADGALLTTFTNPTPAAGDAFGWSVADAGSGRVLIGAYQDDTGATDSGAAYLFDTNGTLLATFSNPVPAEGDYFGAAMAALGTNHVLIGSPFNDTGATNAGVASLYELQPTSIHYVNIANPTPVPPYTSWATAATNIQDAVDAACARDTVLVTNGVYNTGGSRAPGSGPTRVTVETPVSLLSVNGPKATIIEGYQVPGTTNGPGAIRCVYLCDGSSLSGFSLTKGATDIHFGGGVLCESTNPTISNCVIVGNAAWGGGGVVRGTLNACSLTGNSAVHAGGGAWGSVLNNCMVSSNSVTDGDGGGVYISTLDHCVLQGNSADGDGGGAESSTLNNCGVADNLAGNNGGGANDSILENCRVVGNHAGNYGSGGGGFECALNNCLVIGNTAFTAGGAGFSALTNCTIVGNSALYDGGGVYGRLHNCVLYYNTAPNSANYYDFLGDLISYTCTYPMLTNGVGNITNAPLFVDTNNWADLRLRPDSPCIDAGNNDFVTWDTDLDGNPRILNGIVDMGAYEFVPLTPPELVQHLMEAIANSGLNNKRPLLASLEAALASIERGSHYSAMGQLGAFQNKVVAQVYKNDPEFAVELIYEAEEIRAALEGRERQ